MNWTVHTQPSITGLGLNRIHASRCGNYRVTESVLRGLSKRVYALKVCGRRTVILSTHRKVSAAKAACNKHDRRLK